MKYDVGLAYAVDAESLPAWGVRVEMIFRRCGYGRRIRHSPHGECGLKYPVQTLHDVEPQSLPAWGVRVEIKAIATVNTDAKKSLPAWGVRVEIRWVRGGEKPSVVTPRMGSAG